jgi:hypothetical protein
MLSVKTSMKINSAVDCEHRMPLVQKFKPQESRRGTAGTAPSQCSG